MKIQNVNSPSFTSLASAISLNPGYGSRYLSTADTFVQVQPKANPAVQNPIYRINDNFLASLVPKELINKYANPAFLSYVIQVNPNITSDLAEALVPTRIYSKNISSAINSHFVPTTKAAYAIMRNCKENFNKNDYLTMNKAALLHDVGKAFIPDAILNKNGKLNNYERKVVDKHAQIGYEILKSGGMTGPVLELVKKHHSYSKNNPPLVQILQIADIYSALKETRPYKAAFSDEKALAILYERAQNGDFEAKYVDALKKSVAA